MTIINKNANTEFHFPHNNKSGTRINSSVFMIAIITICEIAFNRDFRRLTIQIAIAISKTPIKIVRGLEYLGPKMFAIIC